MFRLERESDPEKLRQAALILERENERLIRKNLELTREVENLKGLGPEKLELKLRLLEEQLSRARQELFGRSSEKLGGAREVCARAPRKGHGPREQPCLPVVEEVHELDEPDRACPKCGGRLSEWPEQFEESEEITLIERRFVLIRHKRKKYRCNCQACVETALGPRKLFPGARYSVDFAVHVAVAKYADHLPLERQRAMMAREGLEVSSQTLWDQIHALKTLCEPLHGRIGACILESAVVFADETPWRMLRGQDSGRWYIWGVSDRRLACYRILESRSKEAAAQVLGGFRGTLVADGYGAYGALARDGPRTAFRLANCWAHARRYFFEVRDDYPGPCEWFLKNIAELYEIERLVPAHAGLADALQMRRALRTERSLPIALEIREQAERILPTCVPQSGLFRALVYLRNQWEGLTVFLDDPRVPLDNNTAERALRGAVLGRKNHLGSKSTRGAEVTGFFYTIVESCKLSRVDPARYLRDAARAFLAGTGTDFPLPHQYRP